MSECIYFVFGLIVAGLAGHGAMQLSSSILGPPPPAGDTSLAIGIAVFIASLAFVIKAVDAIRDERIRSELDALLRHSNSN
jgi:hypothetical protein